MFRRWKDLCPGCAENFHGSNVRVHGTHENVIFPNVDVSAPLQACIPATLINKAAMMPCRRPMTHVSAQETYVKAALDVIIDGLSACLLRMLM
jgi:hypothetical protein